MGREPIYRIYFHGPAYQVLEGVHLEDGRAIGSMVHGLPPNGDPANAASLMAPRLIELCFQTAGILEVARDQRLALPTAYDGCARIGSRTRRTANASSRSSTVGRATRPSTTRRWWTAGGGSSSS